MACRGYYRFRFGVLGPRVSGLGWSGFGVVALEDCNAVRGLGAFRTAQFRATLWKA